MIRHVTVNARDPHALATFWAAALDGRLQDDDLPGDPEALVTSRSGPPLLFVQADGRHTHLDLQPDLPRAHEVDRLLALGATLVDDQTRPDGTGWVVLADPEGNPFCVERSAAERGLPGPHDTGERDYPRVHTAGEREALTALLDWYREGVLAKVEGMTDADALASPLRSGTSAAGLVKHLAYVEDAWATERLAGQPAPEPWAGAPFDDDPDWEFHSPVDLAEPVALYRAACARTRAVTEQRALDDTAVDEGGRTISLRFVLLHLLEETARHLGHLDVLRELADGVTGE
ncbi:MAG: hypothetical protein JWM64_2349 [Frankiales bacterium]|nr:hypothetical protein [Frankiales bacterium]